MLERGMRVQTIAAKQILIKNKSDAWFGADYTMNLYKGCCHGCVYCDSRSACYGVEQFDAVRAKRDALALLRGELAHKRRTGVIATGAMSDPYNPFETREKLTRGALEQIAASGFGVAIATKSAQIVRDIDVLQRIRAHAPVLCKISLTTVDDELARILEPHVSLPSKRLAALQELHRAGIPAGVLWMPVLPYLTDSPANMDALLNRAYEHGARFVYPGWGVTLRGNQRAYFYAQLDRHFPGLSARYRAQYGDAYACATPYLAALVPQFRAFCRSHGLLFDMADIVADYKQDHSNVQLCMFPSIKKGGSR